MLFHRVCHAVDGISGDEVGFLGDFINRQNVIFTKQNGSMPCPVLYPSMRLDSRPGVED